MNYDHWHALRNIQEFIATNECRHFANLLVNRFHLMVYPHFLRGQVKESWYKAWAKAERILDPSVLSPYSAIIVL